jgi:CheY-like chemotaxis protein
VRFHLIRWPSTVRGSIPPSHWFQEVGFGAHIASDLIESSLRATKSITASAVVLLLQPQRDDREMYAEFLRFVGLTPVVLSDATRALSLARHVDVIVTDLILPGHLDGFDFIRRLKRDHGTQDIPVIVLTASAWNTERERAASAGCDVFLAKPCLPYDLLHEICRLMPPSKVGTMRRRPAVR